jgi:hypothetical protein
MNLHVLYKFIDTNTYQWMYAIQDFYNINHFHFYIHTIIHNKTIDNILCLSLWKNKDKLPTTGEFTIVNVVSIESF